MAQGSPESAPLTHPEDDQWRPWPESPGTPVWAPPAVSMGPWVSHEGSHAQLLAEPTREQVAILCPFVAGWSSPSC